MNLVYMDMQIEVNFENWGPSYSEDGWEVKKCLIDRDTVLVKKHGVVVHTCIVAKDAELMIKNDPSNNSGEMKIRPESKVLSGKGRLVY